MDDQVLHEFTSHIEGKNAKVRIYVDRVEWQRPGSALATAAKIAGGITTAGLSFAATGVRGGKKGTEMIPVKSMSSVTTARDGILNTKVVIVTSGNTIDFRVSHSEAATVKKVLTQLILGSHPAQQAAAAPPTPPPAPAVPASPTAPAAAPAAPRAIGDRLAQLETLKAQGILTEQEYAAKRTAILSEL